MSEPRFALGDLVRHRATLEQGVVLARVENDQVRVGWGFGRSDEAHDCELEPIPAAPVGPLLVFDQVLVAAEVVAMGTDVILVELQNRQRTRCDFHRTDVGVALRRVRGIV